MDTFKKNVRQAHVLIKKSVEVKRHLSHPKRFCNECCSWRPSLNKEIPALDCSIIVKFMAVNDGILNPGISPKSPLINLLYKFPMNGAHTCHLLLLDKFSVKICLGYEHNMLHWSFRWELKVNYMEISEFIRCKYVSENFQFKLSNARCSRGTANAFLDRSPYFRVSISEPERNSLLRNKLFNILHFFDV